MWRYAVRPARRKTETTSEMRRGGKERERGVDVGEEGVRVIKKKRSLSSKPPKQSTENTTTATGTAKQKKKRKTAEKKYKVASL